MEQEDIISIETLEKATTAYDNSTNDIPRGRLKIFLGYCAGVGKTYRMLQEGIISKQNNFDVVIGIVETHGRSDTELLTHELTILPRKKIQYSGITIEEMDLDGLLEARPQVVLVDELAHTNMPGSRHSKRFQDVEELLNAGIDVYSTLNIQHIQSLVDIVYQITGIKVEETIPDRILESAIEIELVDLSPEKLQKRLEEGKVYIPQKAKLAMQKFFKKGNLIALRELSLKYTAKRVDTDLLSYREKEEILEVWPVESKLLVGISSNKNTERILLITHRMAVDLNAEWYAVHVESVQQARYTAKARNQLYRNINLAEELGAKVVSLSGNSVADEIVKFAKQKNITLIIAGLSQRSIWQEFIKGSVLNNLVRKASPINVLVVGGNTPVTSSTKKAPPSAFTYKPYTLGILSVIAVFVMTRLSPTLILPHNILMILLLPTLLAGILGGTLVGFFTALIAVILYNFLYVPSSNLPGLEHIQYIKLSNHLPSIIFFIFIVLGVSWIGRMIRWRADSARNRERFVYALYNFSREIIGAKNAIDVINRATRSIHEAFDSDVIVLLPTTIGHLELTAKSKPELTLEETEIAVAVWVYKNGRHGGRGTNTLSSAEGYYIPLKTSESVLGVICLMKPGLDYPFTPEQKRLLEAFAGIVALALAKFT